MTPRWNTHWEVSAIHPDKKEPFDTYINFFHSEAKAREVADNLKREGYEYINVTPPRK